MPCAGPVVGLPERESSSPRAAGGNGGSGGKAGRAGSRQAGASRSGQAPPSSARRRPSGRAAGTARAAAAPRFSSPGGSSLVTPVAAGTAAGRRPPPGRRYLQSPSSRSRVPFMSRMRLARAGTGCMARSSSSQRATSAYMARMLRSAASPRLSTPSR